MNQVARPWRAAFWCLVLALGIVGCASGPIPVRRLPTPTPVIARALQDMPAAQPAATPGQVAPLISPAEPRSAIGPTLDQVSASEETPEPRAEAIGEIRIPRLGVVSSIVEVSWRLGELEGQPVAEWETLPDAVGHHIGTAPLGGAGNCVLSGHSRVDRDGAVTGVFRRLHELSPGDRIELVDGASLRHQYVVQRTETIQELGASVEQRMANASFMGSTADGRLTMITCWPDWGYTHRLIVVAALQ